MAVTEVGRVPRARETSGRFRVGVSRHHSGSSSLAHSPAVRPRAAHGGETGHRRLPGVRRPADDSHGTELHGRVQGHVHREDHRSERRPSAMRGWPSFSSCCGGSDPVVWRFPHSLRRNSLVSSDLDVDPVRCCLNVPRCVLTHPGLFGWMKGLFPPPALFF